MNNDPDNSPNIDNKKYLKSLKKYVRMLVEYRAEIKDYREGIKLLSE